MAIKDDTPVPPSNSRMPRALPGLDEIRVGTVAPLSFWHNKWRHLIEILLLQLAFLGGLVVAMLGAAWSVGEGWKFIFVAMAMLCVGFGAATLLYSRFGANRVAELESMYRRLREQSDVLVGDLNRFESKKSADRR